MSRLLTGLEIFLEKEIILTMKKTTKRFSGIKWMEIIQLILLINVILLKETTTKKYYPDLSNESLSQRSIRKGLEILKRGTRRYQRHIFV